MSGDEQSIGSAPTMTGGYRPTLLDEPSLGSVPTMVPGTTALPHHQTTAPSLGRIDQYELIRKLGGGGFGVVYLARDTVSGVEVALKTLHPLMKSNAEEMERLREKFALVHGLTHPNIAKALVLHPVREISIADDEARRELRLSPGDSVMVMDYAPGTTLSRWRRQFGDGVVPLPLVLEIGRQIASALDYAHSERIVHRDIKPANVMVETLSEESRPSRVESSKLKVESSGAATQHSTFQLAGARIRVRLLDFGLAAEIRSSMSRVSSETGDTSGTRPYMAPEQWLGRKQDGRTDQYALACVLYELLAGEPPFAGVFETGDPAIMERAVTARTPDEIDGVPPAVNAALLRALSKTPRERFQSCEAFVEAFSGGEILRAKSATFAKNSTLVRDATVANPSEAGRPGEPVNAAELEADVLRRKVALARAFSALPAKDRTDAGLATMLSEADTELNAAEEAFKYGRFAAAAQCLDRAETAFKSYSSAKEGRAVEAWCHARERAARRRLVLKWAVRAAVALVLVAAVLNAVEAFADWVRTTKVPTGEKRQRVIQSLLDNMIDIPLAGAPGVFKMGKFEVTQLEWAAVMGTVPSCFKGPERPVECVSWEDCQEFLLRLNDEPAVRETGLVFRLPMAGERRFACRAGAAGPYCRLADGTEITEDILDRVAWYTPYSLQRTTYPVGRKEPNAFGLYDMLGNVEEWTGSVHEREEKGWRGEVVTNKDAYVASVHGVGSWPMTQTLSCDRGLRLVATPTNDVARQILSSMAPVPGKDYLVCRTEVTEGQWRQVMGGDANGFYGDFFPVERVSWDDCQKFLKRLNVLPSVEESGLVFRLPNEEEWEYACRAGSAGEYCALADGTEITGETLGRVAWTMDNSMADFENSHHKRPVGQKEPNAFGLYDMLGNVWEWTETGASRFSKHIAGASKLDMRPTETAEYAYRICRGGGYYDRVYEAYLKPDVFRGAFARVAKPSDYHDDLYGLRLFASGRTAATSYALQHKVGERKVVTIGGGAVALRLSGNDQRGVEAEFPEAPVPHQAEPSAAPELPVPQNRPEPAQATSVPALPAAPADDAPVGDWEDYLFTLKEWRQSLLDEGYLESDEQLKAIAAAISAADERIAALTASIEDGERKARIAKAHKDAERASNRARIAEIRLNVKRKVATAAKYDGVDDRPFVERRKSIADATNKLDGISDPDEIETVKRLRINIDDAVDWILRNGPAQEGIAAQEEELTALAPELERVGAARLAAQSFNAARRQERESASLRDKADYEAAADGYRQAKALYEKAILEAEMAQSEACAVRAEGLKESGLWEDCLKAANEALEWDAGNAKAQTLKQEAQNAIDAERKAKEEAAARRTAEESARLPAARNSSVFFPVYGITLGKTTLKEIRGLGGTSSGKFASKCVDYRELTWWDNDKDGVCEYIAMFHFDPMPPEWVRLGMDWGMSYDDWTAFFRRRGFAISTTDPIFGKAPTVEIYQGRKTLSAKFKALSPDGRLSFYLDFDFGNKKGEGHATLSRNSLYSIFVEMKR